MDMITKTYSRLTKVHFIGIGVILLAATVISIGIVVSHRNTHSSSLSPSFHHFKEKLAKIDHAIQWVRYNGDNVSLDNALTAGKGEYDDTIYICRSTHHTLSGDELIPGTYSPKKGCLVTYGRRVHSKEDFELLEIKDQSAVIWLPNSEGEIYNGAVIGGITSNREVLPIARGELYNFYAVGKIHGKYKLAYLPDNDIEIEMKVYENLCLRDYVL